MRCVKVRTVRFVVAYNKKNVDVNLSISVGTKNSSAVLMIWLLMDRKACGVAFTGWKIYIWAGSIDEFAEKVVGSMDSLLVELVKTLQVEQRQAEQRANELLDMPDYMAHFYWNGKAKALADTIQQIKRMEKKGTAG
ncbi:hypothetical protein [Aneurinibacillus migulanus]|uniref:Uncharacterized protein n=2 Tax=Aneurinibacillus migulanus TaxID=47500 RepID=A0A1G8UAZ7_ANEMI|nr:hypothetical protein [Aneurinibacillus migulanus]SDJ51006.1 hypothetical protein SAMN04487909_11974 [Aneurinibacillus migulanus]